MKAQDLKIGNYVYQGKNYGYDKISSYELYQFDLLQCGDSVSDYYHNWKPIPLTEEWLLKFGFDDSEYNPGYIGKEFKSNIILDFVLTKPKTMGEWQKNYTFELRIHRIVSVEFVHQLQNLYFALTGEELTIIENEGNN